MNEAVTIDALTIDAPAFPVTWENPADAELTWTPDGTHFPRPLSPLFRTLWVPAFERGITQAQRELVVPGFRLRVAAPNGFLYQTVEIEETTEAERAAVEATLTAAIALSDLAVRPVWPKRWRRRGSCGPAKSWSRRPRCRPGRRSSRPRRPSSRRPADHSATPRSSRGSTQSPPSSACRTRHGRSATDRSCTQSVPATRLVLTTLLLAAALLFPAAAIAQEPTPDRNAPVKADGTPIGSEAAGIERLVDDQPLLTDEFGRVPLMRATFAPGAELPPAFEIPERDEPIPFFLDEELLILVERGTFSFTTDAETVTADEGERIELSVAASLSIRNDGEDEGSLLILRTAFDYLARFPLSEFSLNPVAPEGIVFDHLFKRQDLRGRLLEVRFSLDRVTLQPGEELASLDFGGPTATRSISLRMESGAIVGPDGTTETEPLTPDGESNAASIDPPDDIAVRAIGTEPAVFLVARVAEAR